MIGVPRSHSADKGVVSLLDVDDPEWRAMLDEVPHDFYHLPGYVAVAAAELGGRPCALSVRGGGVSLLVPLILRDVGQGLYDATSPYGYPGPLLGGTGPRTLGDALAIGFRHLAEQGVVAVFLRLHPLLNAEPGPLPGQLVAHGETVSIELPAGRDELWSRLRENHRRDISRAARLGYVARMDDVWEHGETFRRLYRETMERRGATPSYFFSDAYFTGLREALGDRLRLCVVEGDGQVVAAGLFVETASIVEYHLSGTEQGPHRLQPLKTMIHFVSGWASERGDRALHLGGGVGGADDSLFLFKAGFSPVRHPFRTLRAVLRPQAYRRLVRASGRGRLDVPTASEFFPAYRSAKADNGPSAGVAAPHDAVAGSGDPPDPPPSGVAAVGRARSTPHLASGDLPAGWHTRLVGPSDAEVLAELFANIDTTHFRPHAMNGDGAREVVANTGSDLFVLGFVGATPAAYGLLRGWDDGYDTPSLGVGVRTELEGKGYGRAMMTSLHDRARERGSRQVRLRVDPVNTRALRLYESFGYRPVGTERGETVMVLDLEPQP